MRSKRVHTPFSTFKTTPRYLNSRERGYWIRFLREFVDTRGVLGGDPRGVFCATPFSGSATRCPTGIPARGEMTRAGGPVCKAGPVFRPLRILMYSRVCRWAWECSSCRMVARIGEPEVSQFPHPRGTSSAVPPSCIQSFLEGVRLTFANKERFGWSENQNIAENFNESLRKISRRKSILFEIFISLLKRFSTSSCSKNHVEKDERAQTVSDNFIVNTIFPCNQC